MRRSKHSLSNTKLLSCDMGKLVPIGLTEVLPGDTIQQSTSMLIRCSPLLTPVMHRVDARVHHFYVPHRLVFPDFADSFITGGPDGMDDTVWPTIVYDAPIQTGSLGDYLGLPIGPAGLEVSALPFRGYNLIWNEFFRDQDLQTEVAIDDGPGLDTTTSRYIQNVCWEKDYFTSARPWEQKGPSITIPLGDSAPLRGLGVGGAAAAAAGPFTVKEGPLPGSPNRDYAQAYRPDEVTFFMEASATDASGRPTLHADLSQASAITVTRLREALALQRFEEARAQFGSRYVEYLRYLNVRSSDARLQRPEYLGGGKQTIQFSEVLQTAEGESPVGEMRGHGIGAMRSNRYRRFIEEHGYIFSLLSVRPKTIYMNGLARHWNRRVKEDFWQKELEAIGQQEVLNKEIYAAHANPDGTFGYQDRYDEYRRTESTVAGEFRTSLLNDWHMARDFGSSPALNSDFVTCTPTERVFADQNAHTLRIMANHSIQARRLVSKTAQSYIF